MGKIAIVHSIYDSVHLAVQSINIQYNTIQLTITRVPVPSQQGLKCESKKLKKKCTVF